MDHEELMTSYEVARTREIWRSLDVITGFFKAPADGDYQFHMSCDDQCRHYMSLTTPEDPAAMELLMLRNGWESNYDFRSFGSHSFNNDPDAEDTNVG